MQYKKFFVEQTRYCKVTDQQIMKERENYGSFYTFFSLLFIAPTQVARYERRESLRLRLNVAPIVTLTQAV